MNKKINFSTKEVEYLKEKNCFAINFVIECAEYKVDLSMNGFQLKDSGLLNYYTDEIKRNNEAYR